MDLYEFFARGGSGQRHNLLDFGVIRITIQIQDPHYDQDYIPIAQIFTQFLPEVCFSPITNPLHLGMIQITIRS